MPKSKKGRRGHSGNRKTVDNPIKKFRMEVFRSPNIRAGLNRARLSITPEQIPSIVQEFSKNQMFFGNICEHRFPKSLSQLVHKKRLVLADSAREFMWSASVLSLFTSELSYFVSLRDTFEVSYLSGDWDGSKAALDEIENNLGVSIWLISRRIQLLQSSRGLREQKDFLEKVISTDGISSWVALLTWFSSLRNEDSVSLEMLESELSGLLEQQDEVVDYFTYQIFPYDLAKIKNEAHPISMEERHPIIDRYMAHLWMSELSIARNGDSNQKCVISSLRLLDGINDCRINKLLSLIDDKAFQIHSDQLMQFDAYTVGCYEKVKNSAISSISTIELKARTNLFIDQELQPIDSIEQEVSLRMGEMLLIDGDYSKSKQRLRKLAIKCFHMPMAIKIASFIERAQENTLERPTSEMEIVHALQSDGNPWDYKILSHCFNNIEPLDNLINKHADSPSLLLQKALNSDKKEAMGILDALDLPPYRKDIYRGHILFSNGEPEQAIKSYKSALKTDNEYILSRTNLFLFKVLFTEKLYKECIEQVVRHYLINPSVAAVYPLSELAGSGISNPEMKSSISLAILLSLAARYDNPKWERDLSDIYENILFKLGVEKPSHIDINSCGFQRIELTYFFRYICVQRIMDDTTAFNGISEIEDERIKICSTLMEIDNDNIDVYSGEIKTIIRDEKVTELLDQVHASKVYVDEDGVLSAAEEKMRGFYIRYKKLSDSPDFNYQADKISKLIGDILQDFQPHELMDIQLPASEKEGLFDAMLTYFIEQFAFNPAYGLDANISTSIRHGAFEGHIRHAFAINGLLCERNEVLNKMVIPSVWVGRYSSFSEQEQAHLFKCMERFTNRIENKIDEYLKILLRILTEEYPRGLFSFNNNREGIRSLLESLSESHTYEEFVSGLLDYCWRRVDKSLESIRSLILTDLKVEINKAADSLIQSLERKIEHEKIVDMTDSIISARTEFNALVLTVSDWFQKSKDYGYEPFELELVLEVAMKQVEHCYVNSHLSLTHSFDVKSKICGSHFVGSVELFFILLQNIARHGGVDKELNNVIVNVCFKNKRIAIEVISDLSADVDILERRKITLEAEQNYKKDTAMKMARKEGGSGLSKVWRILEHDFKCQHTLNLTVRDDHKFVVNLDFNSSGIMEA